MFEIGKKGTEKGTDKGQDMARNEQTPSFAPPSEAPRRTSGRDVAVIGPSIRIDGDLRGEEDLLIEGEVKGTVQLKDNRLTIGTQGRVKANVIASSIEVEGLMEGDLVGVERVIVRASAHVKGNIVSPRISVEDGARFKGTIDMDAEAVESAVGQKRGSVAPLTAGTVGAPKGVPAPAAKPAEAAVGGKSD